HKERALFLASTTKIVRFRTFRKSILEHFFSACSLFGSHSALRAHAATLGPADTYTTATLWLAADTTLRLPVCEFRHHKHKTNLAQLQRRCDGNTIPFRPMISPLASAHRASECRSHFPLLWRRTTGGADSCRRSRR